MAGREHLEGLLSAPGRPRRRGTRLAAGGAFGLWMKTGHYEVTQEVAEWFGFSSTAVGILRDAVQDPDFYEWHHPSAHAQTENRSKSASGKDVRTEDLPDADRAAAVAAAIRAYVQWTGERFGRVAAALATNDQRAALYWLGYLLHGVQDLAAHAGRTNAEHAADPEDPDADPEHIALARHYTLRLLRRVREVLGEDRFDGLRSYAGEGAFAKSEKVARFHPKGWDLSVGAYRKYRADGKAFDADWPPADHLIRWPREQVFSEVAEALADPAPLASGVRRPSRRRRPAATSPQARFEDLVSAPSGPPTPADWTVMVYMAGDDTSAESIEYAVKQDLHEMKEVGSTDRLHLVAQTDEATERQSYRYRLRTGTPLAADRLAIFKGDANTGRVATLVDFVRWATSRYPARRYALVLWGHGSGHDDEDIYRLARGRVSPRVAAQLGRRRLGFFASSRRALLERRGPSRGYGYDDTAADFLDNGELRRALRQIRGVIGRELDLLGFDACLMAMVEVAYQVRDAARILVASELEEPGDGWRYSQAFRILRRQPTASAEALARQIVTSFRATYEDESTLAAVRLAALPGLSKELAAVAATLDREGYRAARHAALDCSPEGANGYRDLGSFLAGLGARGGAARQHLQRYVVAACGRIDKRATSGATIYAPDEYRPDRPGSADELYESLDFARNCGWAAMLRRSAGLRPRRSSGGRARPSPTDVPAASARALDRHNAAGILGALDEHPRWLDSIRADVLAPWKSVLDTLLGGDDDDLRIAIVPGIFGSSLHDFRGSNGLVWIDPIGLLFAEDFARLALDPTGTADAERDVLLRATGPVPIVYDRLALALIAAFGAVVEQIGYDWRRSIPACAGEVAGRLRALLEGNRKRRLAIVAHSMGGLVVAQAIRALGPLGARVDAVVTMGTPWRGSYEPVFTLRAEGEEIELFRRLTTTSPEAMRAVVQTFWGLSDLLPADASVLRADLYAPGPLASPRAAVQLASPLGLDRRPPPRTTAILSESRSTVTGVELAGNALVPALGPGDGLVPAVSASDGGRLPVVRVDAAHVTLPLVRDSIAATIELIEKATRRRSRVPSLPPFGPLALAPATSRGALLSRLDEADDADLRLGEVLSLFPLR